MILQANPPPLRIEMTNLILSSIPLVGGRLKPALRSSRSHAGRMVLAFHVAGEIKGKGTLTTCPYLFVNIWLPGTILLAWPHVFYGGTGSCRWVLFRDVRMTTLAQSKVSSHHDATGQGSSRVPSFAHFQRESQNPIICFIPLRLFVYSALPFLTKLFTELGIDTSFRSALSWPLLGTPCTPGDACMKTCQDEDVGVTEVLCLLRNCPEW